MVKYFCDICGTEMSNREVHSRMETRRVLDHRSVRGKLVYLDVIVVAKIPEFANDGYVCYRCIAETLRERVDRELNNKYKG